MSASVTSISSFRSALFARNSIGTFPVTFTTAATHSPRSSRVCLRVTSQTARTPWAPWKYASFNSSRNPFSPMMSQIVMSMSDPPFGPSNLISFFETFAPSVEMYRSSNWSWMNRRMRQVLPTAPSPTRQIFTFIFWRSICILWLGLTRHNHSVSALRRRQEVRRIVDRAHPREFFLADDESLAQVHLVSQEDDGDGPDLLADHLDPVVQVVEGVLPREVGT